MVKNNKGVSMLVLVVTIVIMLILTGYAVYYSNNIAPEARLVSSYASLSNIKAACESAKSQIELAPETYDEFYFFGYDIRHDGSDVEDLARRCGLYSSYDFGERTYKISPENTDDARKKVANLEISGINQTYIVDLDNDRYYLLDGVKKANNLIVYELNDVEGSYRSGDARVRVNVSVK